MMIKRFQLALVHVAVALTLVPINSTLNRVMIKEMAISAALVSVLASMPYLFSPVQVLIGSYSDRHPIFGWRRTPYIVAGLLLCVLGVVLAPQVVFIMPDNWWLGLALTFLVFMAWGMGFNLASVSYLSLASELSGEKGRTRTISVMWFMMIVGIIITAATLSRLIGEYSPASLKLAFEVVGAVALGLGLLGLLGLEPRHRPSAEPGQPPDRIQPERRRASWRTQLQAVMASPQSRIFFLYLILLLGAILGQDVLLEPFAGETFHLPVQATTRITSIWGTCVLATLLFGSLLERWLPKKTIAHISAWVALAGFLVIAGSGLAAERSVFYSGVVLLGLGTGLSTVSNLSLMLDMTTARTGLFIGAWGVADALARLVGTVLSGVVRDLVTHLFNSPVGGYVTVFLIQAGLLLISIFILRRIDVQRFRKQSQSLNMGENMVEKAAYLNDLS